MQSTQRAGRHVRQGGRWLSVAAGVVVIALALILYLATLDDGLEMRELQGGDLITHQYAQVQGRPSNAPGYPLYTMGGWLWFRVGRGLLGPWLNPTSVLSLYSTFWALAALVMLYLLGLELSGGRWGLAALGTVFYGATYFFWYYAVTTEQYTSAVFQTLVILWLAFRWQRERRDSYLVLLALVCGLSLAHMVTVLLVVPPLVWFIWREDPQIVRRWKLLEVMALVALLPLLAYAYVYARGAAHPEWWGEGSWPDAWRWFLAFVSTRQGREELTWTLGPFTDEFPWLVVREMTWPGLLAGLGGILTLGRRRAGLLLGTLALYLAFCYVDRYGNWYQVWMPMYAILTLGLVAAASAVWRHAERRWGGRWAGWVVRALVIAALALLALSRLIAWWPEADQRGKPTDDGLRAGLAILADGPEVGAAVLAQTDEALSLQYVTQVWGERPDVEAVSADRAREVLATGKRPLYVTVAALPVFLEEVTTGAHLSSAGMAMARAAREPLMGGPGSEAQFLHDSLGGGLELVGYRLRPACSLPEATRRWLLPSGEAGPGVVHLTLWWRAAERPAGDFAISVRPTRSGGLISQGGVLVQQDRPAPVWGYSPTSRWEQGELVRDDYLLFFGDAWPYDGLLVIPYRPVEGGFENLKEVRIPVIAGELVCE